MFQNGRSVDPDFDLDEQLYRRCCPTQVVENRLLPEAINFPDWSVNRAKYSQPEDVLFPNFHCCGIASFRVRDIPRELKSGGEKGQEENVFEFKVVHCPEEDNYSHSEVRTYKNGIHDKSDKNFKNKINKTVKKEFRQLLSDRTTLIRQPNAEKCVRDNAGIPGTGS